MAFSGMSRILNPLKTICRQSGFKIAGQSSTYRYIQTCSCPLNKILLPKESSDQRRCLNTTAPRQGLMEFFDEEDNWGKAQIKTGRPWRCDELRLKSNADLHKLWYVLLKERNMVMTMQAEYERLCEVFPNPERIEKLEESMENVLEVIKERDRAVNLLETGESGEPGQRWAYNQLGQGYWHRCREHYVPQRFNKVLRARVALSGKWQYRYKRLYREKLVNQEHSKMKKREEYEKRLYQAFPDLQEAK